MNFFIKVHHFNNRHSFPPKKQYVNITKESKENNILQHKWFLVIPATFCSNLLSQFVKPATVCNNFLSDFVIIILKFVKLSLFVTLSNAFFQKDQKRVNEVILSHFVIKAVITKNLDSIHILCLLSAEEKAIANH